MSIPHKTLQDWLSSARHKELVGVLRKAVGATETALEGQIQASQEDSEQEAALGTLKIVLMGAISAGKNAVGITRTGKRYPKARFVAWREFAMAQMYAQLPSNWQTITVPVNIEVDYYPGDLRRKDFPGIIDGLFHVMEKCKIVSDDSLIWVVRSSRALDRERPRTEITIQLP